jgi:hypothetical protein
MPTTLCKRSLFTLLAALISLQALAWREAGHYTICEIAYRNLEPAIRAKLDGLLQRDSRSIKQEFATLCTWPDRVRKTPRWAHTFNWHFVNFTANKTYFETLEPKGDVLQALAKNEDELRSPTTSDEAKVTAALFVSHLMGDLHQPLHMGHVEDLGGNKTTVEWFGLKEFRYVEPIEGGFIDKVDAINLHKIWDVHLVEEILKRNPNDDKSEFGYKFLATKVALGDDEQTKSLLSMGSYFDWGMTSAFYNSVVEVKTGSSLGDEYYEKHAPLVELKLAQGGLRLAAVLNAALSDSPPALSAREEEFRCLIDQRQKLKDAPAPTEMMAQEKHFELEGITQYLCALKNLSRRGRLEMDFGAGKKQFALLAGKDFDPAQACR